VCGVLFYSGAFVPLFFCLIQRYTTLLHVQEKNWLGGLAKLGTCFLSKNVCKFC
jgi:hypothetical protein